MEQDLGQVKVGLEFTEDVGDEEEAKERVCEDIPDVQVDENHPEVDDKPELIEVESPKGEKSQSEVWASIKQTDEKLKKLRKFLSTSQQRRFETVTNFTDHMHREDLPLAGKRKKTRKNQVKKGKVSILC